jgi:TIR domain
MSSSVVFISYSRQDREFAERLSSELQAAGIRTWTDTQNIQAGANWQQEIENGLLQADALLYVASGQASSSNWIEYEVEEFLRRKGRVIPLVIDDAGTLSVVSPDWKKSPRALQELHFSNEVGTPVFLLRLRNPGPTLALAGLTFIDFTEAPSSGFQKLASEMQAVGL